jgi:hypothetical protein
VHARGIEVIVDLAEQSDVDPAARRARAVPIAELYFAARQAPGDKAADLGVGDPAARSFQGGNRLNREFPFSFAPPSPCCTVQHGAPDYASCSRSLPGCPHSVLA